MVEVIVSEIQPKKIILFGSQAKGNIGMDSDVDLLIIDEHSFGPKRSRRKEMARIWRALGEFMLPIDILLYSEKEIEERRHSMNNIAARALREGRILYERH
jgi:predicted nucleotidyltransferase